MAIGDSSAVTVAGPPHVADQDRWLALDGTFNLRDAGGYPTGDGGLIRRRTLFRGDNLHQLSEPARTALLDLGLRTIIDLRGDEEAELWPNVWRTSPTVAYHHLPLPNRLLLHSGAPPPLHEIYQVMLEHGQSALRQILTILARDDAWPALVHCTAGKDRTGVMIALLLGLAGVSAETIAADYALTARALASPELEVVRRTAANHGFAWATTPELLACGPETMRETLAFLERSGGIEAFVRHLGLSDQQIGQIRAALVEPGRAYDLNGVDPT